MKDFNVKITVRNARVLAKIRESYDSVAEFCRVTGLRYTGVNSTITMHNSAVLKSGDWSKVALDIAGALGVLPRDLWPEHLESVIAKRATAEIELDSAEIAALTSDQTPEIQYTQRNLLANWSSTLTPRELTAIQLELEGATFEESGRVLGGVSKARAAQIRAKALRKMRHQALKGDIHSVREAS